MTELAVYDINKRNILIKKIIDLIQDEKMSQVECYGVLEHCKLVIFYDNINDAMKDSLDELLGTQEDEEDKEDGNNNTNN